MKDKYLLHYFDSDNQKHKWKWFQNKEELLEFSYKLNIIVYGSYYIPYIENIERR